MSAEDMLELVRGRSSPGVLILDLKGNLLYSNEEALSILPNPQKISPEIRRLCKELTSGSGNGTISVALTAGKDGGESPLALRAFLIGAQGSGGLPTHIMVLVEKVTEQHSLNLKKAKSRYGLSDREVEVVTLVAEGLANKEIAAKLFVSEHTVKDHLKNIMRKMNAASRSEIIHLLK